MIAHRAPRCLRLPITLVVLPGLDGTTALLSEFESISKAAFKSVRLISYPQQDAQSYAELEALVRSTLPKDPFVLLGESFSGPIAIAIAANPPANFRGLVLSTTFAHNPVVWFNPEFPLADAPSLVF